MLSIERATDRGPEVLWASCQLTLRGSAYLSIESDESLRCQDAGLVEDKKSSGRDRMLASNVFISLFDVAPGRVRGCERNYVVVKENGCHVTQSAPGDLQWLWS